MAGDTRRDLTVYVTRLTQNDAKAAEELWPLVYDELKRLAGGMLHRERGDHTLQPTALVHEAFMRLVPQKDARIKGKAHFHALAAEAMRRILVDYARRRKALKRGAGEVATLLDDPDAGVDPSFDLLELHDALEKLEGLSDRQAKVVELRYFGGLSVEEVAEVLDVSPRTVKGDWRVARVWLQRELASAPETGSDE